MPDETTALVPGTTLHGMTIRRVLGRGGFGITYLAQNPRHGLVAVKEFLPQGLVRRDSALRVRRDSSAIRQLGMDEADFDYLLEQFKKEATRICGFSHPGVVRGLEYHTKDDSACLVMNYVSGHSLRDHLRKRDAGGFTPSPASVARLLERLLSALDYIHGCHCLHCDIKPGNIFLGTDMAPVLIDFGSARHAFHERCFSPAERIQSFTPYYAPAELAPGGQGMIGPWTDVYQVAAVIYRCLTGAKIPSAEERRAAGRSDPYLSLEEYFESAPEAWPQPFLKAIDWGLRFDLRERPQTVAAWQRHLQPIILQMLRQRTQSPVTVAPPSYAQVIPSPVRSDSRLPSTFTVVTTKQDSPRQWAPPPPPPDTVPGALKILLYLLIAALMLCIIFIVMGH